MKTFIQSILVAAMVLTFGWTSAQARSSGYDNASQYMRAGKSGHGHKKHGKKKSASLKHGDRHIASVHKAKKKKKKKHRHY